jgi:hypothetical protein
MHGKEAENLESMKASHQRIPDYLKNQVRPPERLLLIWHIFWELSLGRDYFATGKARRIKPTDIIKHLGYYGFSGYKAEEIKSIIYSMDVKYCDFDNAQFQRAVKNSK